MKKIVCFFFGCKEYPVFIKPFLKKNDRYIRTRYECMRCGGERIEDTIAPPKKKK